MRLLNAISLDFEDFVGEVGDGIPPYAILSHTWGSEEVSYSDYIAKQKLSTSGYKKIIGCCQLAASEGFEYVWVDTCCIDKSSSAELSEAINSMFQWYRDAGICYAYLDDIDVSEDPKKEDSSFARSRWFSRGWTLQELLAPLELVFLGPGWVEIGTKKSLRNVVSQVTRISQSVLENRQWADYSIAQKMSWAAGRQTTRLEDEAYCLMGLFDVNMPLLYGEGRKAFSRLQQEILRQSDDQSIFAWSFPKEQHAHTQISGLMARSPEYFKEASRVEILRSERDQEYENPFHVVNQLVRVRIRCVDQVKAIKLKWSSGSQLYNIIDIQQAGEKRKGAASVTSSAGEIHHDVFGEEKPPSPTFQLEQPISAPVIDIVVEDMSPQANDDVTESLPEPLPEPLSESRTDAKSLIPFIEITSEPLDADSYIQNPTSEESTINVSWRWYIYEPAIIVPLRCHIGGQRLGILLSRGSIETKGRVLSRLHHPSLVGMKTVLDSQLTPLSTFHANMFGRTNDELHSLQEERRRWPEIRISSLLSAGYSVHDDCGWAWKLDQSKVTFAVDGPIIYDETRDWGPLALFYRIDRSPASSFFLSIPGYQNRDMTCEFGVFKITSAALNMTLPYYSLYSFDLDAERRVELPIGNDQTVVIKYREGTGTSFVILLIEDRNPKHPISSIPHNSSKTEYLNSKIFLRLKRSVIKGLSA